jgi:hypothetical protein
MGKRGKREFVQVLRLLVASAATTLWPASSRARGAIGFDAVKHLVLQIERRLPRLD